MNNLLQSLSSQRLQLCVPDTDLKRLLAAVKEGRSHDAKLADAFYDSLEGVLHDLRTVTLDNRDAEAFLKPVSKTDYPDYYEIIANPMDLQTMLKKVKQKQYKSKREFQDDLELIWSNCFVYNTGDGHPLRLCATRLKAKATRLLHNITDRKERVDPTVPPNLSISLASSPTPAPPKPNGITLNGTGHTAHSQQHQHNRQRSTPPAPLVKLKSPSETPTLMSTSTSTPTTTLAATATAYPIPPAMTKPVLREVPFPETPAFSRTPSGMATFMQLDSQLDGGGPSTSSNAVLADRLRSIAGIELDSDSEMDMDVDGPVNGDVGDKRKIAMNGIHRPRKRARVHSRTTPRLSSSSQSQDPIELWWEATRSCTLMANAVPTLKYSSSSRTPSSSSTSNSNSKSQSAIAQGRQGKSSAKRKPRKQKRKPPEGMGSGEGSGTLLALINNNIRTMKRVRRTHDKFLALNPSSADDSGVAGGGGGVGAAGSGITDGSMSTSMSMSMSMGPGERGGGGGGMGRMGSPTVEEEEVDVRVDETPWRPRGRGLAMGEQEAGKCVQWMGGKVLEHAGFQGTSKAALDVFAGVTAEYLLNVGRTIRFMCDKYSRTMTPEEIILHTLFESGITHIRDLERYIKDDVIRYGGRLSDLEKKLVGAYREVTAVDALDDDAFFGNEDDDEEENELVMGNFADAFGEDFLGLRELGIAGEHGLSSLTVPKKLLKGKYKGRLGNQEDSAKPTEPPPPYPPPPPFIPLDTHKLEEQIGLLRPFYLQKFSSLPAASAAFIAPHPHPQPQPQPSTTLPSTSTPALPATAAPSLQLSTEFQLGTGTPTLPQQTSSSAPAPTRPLLPIVNPSAPPVVLPEDPPNPTRTKIGPLGQILKTGATGASAKKKTKAKEPAATAGSGDQSALASGGGDAVGGGSGGGEAFKKKKTAGAGKKKEKGKSEVPLPAVVVASA